MRREHSSGSSKPSMQLCLLCARLSVLWVFLRCISAELRAVNSLTWGSA